MGHITYVRGVGSPVVVIICYSCKNFNLFLFFYSPAIILYTKCSIEWNDLFIIFKAKVFC